MIDELRDRMIEYLSQHPFCIVSTCGALGEWATPAWQVSSGLDLTCLLPRWVDALYYIEQDPQVLVLIPDAQSENLRWLQVRGIAQSIEYPDWNKLLPPRLLVGDPRYRYAAIRIIPERMDLIDENRGWGARETIDF